MSLLTPSLLDAGQMVIQLGFPGSVALQPHAGGEASNTHSPAPVTLSFSNQPESASQTPVAPGELNSATADEDMYCTSCWTRRLLVTAGPSLAHCNMFTEQYSITSTLTP